MLTQRQCVLLILVGLFIFTGCGKKQRRTFRQQETLTFGKKTQEELRADLDRFENFFISRITETSDEINEASGSRRIERTTLQGRTRLVQAMRAMMEPEDPVVAFIETWGLVVRLRIYLEQGEGSKLYSDQQPIAVAFLLVCEAEMERIGHSFLDDKQFEDTKRNIYAFARQNPIKGVFSNTLVFATEEKKGEPSAFVSVISAPMAPFRAMEGVDKTADAIMRVRDTGERFTDTINQLPESTKWQMAMLIYDLEETQMTQRFLKSLEDFSASSNELVQTMNQMPTELRKEMVTLLQETEATQTQLQSTLKVTGDTSTQLIQTLEEFQKTTKAFDETADKTAKTAEAWKAASDSINDLVMLFKTKTPRGPDDPPPFTMRDFDGMLVNAGQTADRITGAVAQIEQSLETDVKTEIGKQLRSLIDLIAWRILQLLVALFVLMLAYRFIVKRTAPVKAD
ncbi:MAG: hypothetical protein ACYTET_04725 [Planctomycetota bacterium]|jgi:hypothetical protein